MYDSKTKTSADNTSSVTFDSSPRMQKHQVKIITTGTVTTGTASVSVDGQTISGTIDLTDPAPYLFEASCDTIVVSPSSFDGTTFTATMRSWSA